MGEVRVRYGQTVKVTNPSDRYENSTFSISAEVSRPYADPPEDDAEYTSWLAGRKDLILEETDHLRSLVEPEIQNDVDKFIEENSPEG